MSKITREDSVERVKAHLVARIRKVKCDEGRPACSRCVSTGRVCDGYGVWGGGGNSYGYRQDYLISKGNSVAPWLPACISVLTDDTAEIQHFEWFKALTVKKISGAFVLAFWDTLVLQASVNEPAVFHAVLALTSVHKEGVFSPSDQKDEQEQFILQHYNTAIRHLRPHFWSKDLASVRVALVTCIIFVCLEFLRGHFQTAETHLQNGLKILTQLRVPSDLENGILLLRPSHDVTDEWIVKAFPRLRIQVELFKQSYQHPGLILQLSTPELLLHQFYSFNDAWQPMERLLNSVFYLTDQSYQRHNSDELHTAPSFGLLEYQQYIQAELARWFKTYEASRENLQSQRYSELPCGLLYGYYTIASIMTNVCLQQEDESIYDSYTGQFVSLINQSIDMWKIGTSRSRVLPLTGHPMGISRSIVDVGWIPPLYYTALKCRIHRLRYHAIRLIEAAFHREGIWDSKIAACVARKVMEIEERDFYKDVDNVDDFQLSSSPELSDLSLPTLPYSYRVQEVKVVLPNSPTDSVLLFYRQKQTSGESTVFVKEFDLNRQCWGDGSTDKKAG